MATKKLVAYYSYSGHSARLATQIANQESADSLEIKDKRRPNKLKTFFVGCPKSISGKPWAIEPLSKNVSEYSEIILVSPIWASNVPPAVNAFLEQLPSGKTVSAKLVSSSGTSNCTARLGNVVKAKGSTFTGAENVKA
jgi:flavodoxin